LESTIPPEPGTFYHHVVLSRLLRVFLFLSSHNNLQAEKHHPLTLLESEAMSKNEDVSLAERCYSALKTLATVDEKLKSRLMTAKVTLLPIGQTAPESARQSLIEINAAFEELETMRRPRLTALAEKIFTVAMKIHADTFSDPR
jgi:hypothetical protein